MLVYGSKTDYAPQFEDTIHGALADDEKLVAAVYFDTWNIPSGRVALLHASKTPQTEDSNQESQTVHVYPDVFSANFIVPGHPEFKISTAGVAHTRSLGFLKKHLGGPFFDLEKIWDEHTYYEFGDRSVENTMATMVQEPYVNHVPTVCHNHYLKQPHH